MAFVIKEHRPGRWRIIAIGIVTLWVASAWLTFEAGRHQSGADYLKAVSERSALQDELERLSDANEELKAQVSRLQQTAQVDRQAKVELAKEVKSFQDQQAELREELSFYKSIISPDEGKTGLRIYGLKVTNAKDGLHHYKLVLTQSGKSDSLAQGRVKLTLKGILKGKETSLDMAKIQVAESPQLSYKFRYFQELTGSIRLPEDFVPREVTARLTPRSGGKSKNPVRTFDWHKARL